MTDCDRIGSLLSLYLEGETSPAEAAQIRGHLKACDECRSDYADMKATVELVRGLPQIQVAEGFEAGVLARFGLDAFGVRVLDILVDERPQGSPLAQPFTPLRAQCLPAGGGPQHHNTHAAQLSRVFHLQRTSQHRDVHHVESL